MQVATYEGVFENGKIRLKSGIDLPENTTVYVVVPDATPQKQVHVYSPRLADPSQAAIFRRKS